MGFFPTDEQFQFESVNKWPSDGIEVSAEQHDALFPVPEGQYIDTVDGFPAWVDLPPPSHDELVATAEVEKQRLISAANDYMNSKQWPGKAAMGRLKDVEKAQYNAWIDYLEAVEAIDTSTAPEIEWPIPPEV